MIGYLRLELMRGLRDPRYLVLALVAPVGFYLLFTNLFGAAQGEFTWRGKKYSYTVTPELPCFPKLP